ncbi:hypothetical protein ACJX0J_040947, partial [Zea mays]
KITFETFKQRINSIVYYNILPPPLLVPSFFLETCTLVFTTTTCTSVYMIIKGPFMHAHQAQEEDEEDIENFFYFICIVLGRLLARCSRHAAVITKSCACYLLEMAKDRAMPENRYRQHACAVLYRDYKL